MGNCSTTFHKDYNQINNPPSINAIQENIPITNNPNLNYTKISNSNMPIPKTQEV